MRSGRPPTLWCDLIVTEGPPVKETALDHVRDRACPGRGTRPAAPVGGDLGRLALEGLDEQPADGLALGLGVGDAGERAEEFRRRLDMDQRDVVVVAEQPHDLVALAGAHQAVVDEDAGELVADRLVDQHRRDRGIDAAGEAADHARLADLGADRLARLARGRRPSSSRA